MLLSFDIFCDFFVNCFVGICFVCARAPASIISREKLGLLVYVFLKKSYFSNASFVYILAEKFQSISQII